MELLVGSIPQIVIIFVGCCIWLGQGFRQIPLLRPHSSSSLYSSESGALAEEAHDDYVYIALYKPALTLCTFRDDQDCAQRNNRSARQTLGDLKLPEVDGIHCVGRLDRDSEGLLLLTNDGTFTSRVADPSAPNSNRQDDNDSQIYNHKKITKRYWARVQGFPTESALDQMRQGGLNIRGSITLSPERVQRIDMDESQLPKAAFGMDRGQSASWLEIWLQEGKNRQIRRITAHAGHKTVRLIRRAIGDLDLKDMNLQPGEWCYIDKQAVLACD